MSSNCAFHELCRFPQPEHRSWRVNLASLLPMTHPLSFKWIVEVSKGVLFGFFNIYPGENVTFWQLWWFTLCRWLSTEGAREIAGFSLCHFPEESDDKTCQGIALLFTLLLSSCLSQECSPQREGLEISSNTGGEGRGSRPGPLVVSTLLPDSGKPRSSGQHLSMCLNPIEVHEN